MSLSSEHRDSDGPSEARKCANDSTSWCGLEANETERRLRGYALELREQVARTWTQHFGDPRSGSTSTLCDANSPQDSRLECWMTPVRWVQQRGPNCGLAVLAMAARPVLACEVSAGGAAYGGGATNNGTDKLQDEVQNAIMRSVYDAHVKNTPWPKHLCPPTLAELQHRAIAKGFSGRGEMFSTKAMASLAAEHQCGRYNVRFVEQSTDEENGFQQETEECDNDNGKMFNNLHCNLSNFDIEILDDCVKFPPCLNKHRVLTTKLGVSSWKMDIVERLMNGNLIAICFDCGKNMMPCSTNDGHTAHWGLLCGVIVEMPPAKTPTQCHHSRKSKKLLCNFDPAEYIGKNEVLDDSNANIHGLLDQVHHNDLSNLNDNIDGDIPLKENSETFTKIFKKQNLNNKLQMLNLDRVWVVARHGKKGGRYAVWSLAELDSSNRQLRTPNDKILQTVSPELMAKWKLYLQNRKQPPLNNSVTKEKSVCNITQQHGQETRDVSSSCHSVSSSHCTTVVSPFKQDEQDEAHKLLSIGVPPLEVEYSLINTETLELASEKNVIEELEYSRPLVSLSPPPPPPPPPLPPPISKRPKIPYYVLKPDENNDKTPYVLPEGPELDHCLAGSFVAFEPGPVPFFVSEHIQYQLVDDDVKAHKLISPLLCHFSFFQKPDI